MADEEDTEGMGTCGVEGDTGRAGERKKKGKRSTTVDGEGLVIAPRQMVGQGSAGG